MQQGHSEIILTGDNQVLGTGAGLPDFGVMCCLVAGSGHRVPVRSQGLCRDLNRRLAVCLVVDAGPEGRFAGPAPVNKAV